MQFEVICGHIPIMRRAYEFEYACFVKESSLHNLYSMCSSILCEWIG